MVIRTRLRFTLTALALYVGVGLLIGYFAMNAYSGNYGLNAKQDLVVLIDDLTKELARAKADRAEWEGRVSLLRPEGLDPDMLDERARAMLDYVHPRDLVLLGRPVAGGAPAVAVAR